MADYWAMSLSSVRPTFDSCPGALWHRPFLIWRIPDRSVPRNTTHLGT